MHLLYSRCTMIIITKELIDSWMIKFPAHTDGKDIGKIEYDYSMCAKACEIPMSDTILFPSEKCQGYFGTKRFDRRGTERIHVLTAATLLELDFT